MLPEPSAILYFENQAHANSCEAMQENIQVHKLENTGLKNKALKNVIRTKSL